MKIETLSRYSIVVSSPIGYNPQILMKGIVPYETVPFFDTYYAYKARSVSNTCRGGGVKLFVDFVIGFIKIFVLKTILQYFLAAHLSGVLHEETLLT